MPLVTGGKQIASLYADIGAKTDNFTKGAATVKGGLKDLAGAIGIVTTAASLAMGAFDFSKQGAELERLADSGAEIARQFGGDMDLIISKVKAASLGTVSEMDIIRSSNRAMMLGLTSDADKLANLMEVAAFRGRAMGVDTTQAFNDIVTGIGRASPMILDNLGIVINAKETYKKYAESIGVSEGELTKAQKTQAIFNAVLTEGNRILEEAGGLVLDNAGKVEKMEASWANFTDNRERENADLAGNFAEAASNAIDGWDQFFKYLDSQGKIREIAINIRNEKDPTGQWQDYFEEARLQWIEQENVINAATSAVEANALAAKEAAAAMEEMSDRNKDFLSLVGTMQNVEETYANKVKSLSEERIELEAEKNSLLAQGYDEQSEKIADINLKLDENTQKAIANADEHELANRRIILGLLERKLTADGILTDDELNWLLEKGVAWGIYSDTVVQEAQAAMDEANQLADTINEIPTEKTITFNLVTNGAPPNLDISTDAANAPVGTHRNSHAIGGNFKIPMSYGNEGFLLGNGDTASGGELINITKAGKDSNDTDRLIAALWAIRIDYAELTRSLIAASQQGMK